MRMYKWFPEALSEIKRDLKEMGIKVHSQTYQDKDISSDPEFEALELQNYIYTVISPNSTQLNPTQPWADKEWGERKNGILRRSFHNPGRAWRLRKDVWEQFLNKSGKFAYTYAERFASYSQVIKIIKRLKEDPDSRQLFISVWRPADVEKLGGISRIPCTLGYYIQCRERAINLTYLQRSADLATHFENDVYLAIKMQEFIAKETGYSPGKYTHWIGSLHVFNKDVKEIF